ncbi:unnamed protein product [Symbiodinium microadriaticum]|nr:unnamed protein product [Symbiodinium microadriaticum]
MGVGVMSKPIRSEIYEAEAGVASAAAQIQKFVSQVARSDAKLNDAKEVRNQEKVSFEDWQKSLSDTIKLLDKAGEACLYTIWGGT